MTKTIWVLWKPGEERVYTMAVQPSEPWATTQKNNGYFLASFDVELPDPTTNVGAMACSSNLKFLHYTRETVDYGITELSAEEAAIRRPGVVIAVQGASDGLVGLCGEIHVHRDGTMWIKGRKIAQVTEDRPAPGYDIFLQFCSEGLLEQIRKVTTWWFAAYGCVSLG